jgi:hypothetical protein
MGICPNQGSGMSALPAPRLPPNPLCGAMASADRRSLARANEQGPLTEYLPCVGELDIPSGDAVTSAVNVEDEQAAAAAAARPRPDPSLDLLARVLRGLRKL